MGNSGRFKVSNRVRSYEEQLHPALRNERRVQRILHSLRVQLGESDARVRARRVFRFPREVFRLEIECPSLGFQRTTLLERDVFEELVADDGVRERIGDVEE